MSAGIGIGLPSAGHRKDAEMGTEMDYEKERPRCGGAHIHPLSMVRSLSIVHPLSVHFSNALELCA